MISSCKDNNNTWVVVVKATTIVTGRYRMRGSIRMSSSSVIPQHETTACGSAQVQIEGSVCTGVLPSCTLLPQPKTIGNINLSPNGDEYRTLLTKLRNNFINPFSLIFTSNLLQPYIKTEFSKLSERVSGKYYSLTIKWIVVSWLNASTTRQQTCTDR